jgi:glycogen synthase
LKISPVAMARQDTGVARVLTVGNLYPPRHAGGYELVWQAAVRALRAAGHEVRVLCSDAPGIGADEPGVFRELPWYWREHAWPRRGLLARWRIERGAAATFDRHVAAFRPDVVSWWSLGGLPLGLLERPRVPAIGWVNDAWPHYGPRVDRWRRLPLVPGVDVGGAARWVFCSAALRDALGLAGPVEHQGVPDCFAPAAAEPWGGRLLYVGRLDPAKGIETAITALRELPGMTLRVVGGGDPAEERRLRGLAAGLPVTFDGPVDRMKLPAVYAQADVTLFPVTWFEPYGLVPLESMAVGRPVVATGRGGSGDYLRDGENALLFEAGDAAGLAAAVRRLAGDPALRERVRAGGLATAAERTEARWLDAVVREHESLMVSAR